MNSKVKIGRQITVAEMAPHVHSFLYGENKVNKISKWLIGWIETSLKTGKIKPGDVLPSKGDLAFHTGVSSGTIQNVFRYVEDYGLAESKQRIGTLIKNKSDEKELKKLTSKREYAIQEIKKFIKNKGLKPGDYIISTRKYAELTGMSNATIRTAYCALALEGILKKVNNSFVIENTNYEIKPIKQSTLVEKTTENIKQYIERNFTGGEKLPSNNEFALMFNVSVKTVHDSIKNLVKDGILYIKRGQYGTIVVNSEEKRSLYSYELVEIQIRAFIAKHCTIGSKLPSIVKFSEMYSLSAKTIKKALNNLAEDGYLTFVRGRYGGTYVTDIPQSINEAYKWLALSSDYIPNT